MRIPRPVAQKIGQLLSATLAEEGKVTAGKLRSAVKAATGLPWAEVDKMLNAEETFTDQNHELLEWFKRDLRHGLLTPAEIGVELSTTSDGFMIVIEARDEKVGRDIVWVSYAPAMDMALERGLTNALKVWNIVTTELPNIDAPAIVVQPVTEEIQKPRRDEKLTVKRVYDAMRAEKVCLEKAHLDEPIRFDKKGSPRVIVVLDQDDLVFGPFNLTVNSETAAMTPVVVTGPELEAHLARPLGLIGLMGKLRGPAVGWYSEEIRDAGFSVSLYRFGALRANRRKSVIGFPIATIPTSLYSDTAGLNRFVVMARDDNDVLDVDDVASIIAALRTITGVSSDLCMRCYHRQHTLLQQALRTHALRRYLAAFGLLASSVRATVPTRD